MGGSFELNDTGGLRGCRGSPSALILSHIPSPFLACSWGSRSSSADDNYAVKVNALTGGLLMLAVICSLSRQRQTTAFALTIRAAKYAHLLLFCVRVYSILGPLICVLSKRLCCHSHVDESAVYLLKNTNKRTDSVWRMV